MNKKITLFGCIAFVFAICVAFLMPLYNEWYEKSAKLIMFLCLGYFYAQFRILQTRIENLEKENQD